MLAPLFLALLLHQDSAQEFTRDLPEQHASASERFVLDVQRLWEPRRGSRYRLFDQGSLVWDKEHPFTLAEPVVTEAGTVVGIERPRDGGSCGLGILAAQAEPRRLLSLADGGVATTLEVLDGKERPFHLRLGPGDASIEVWAREARPGGVPSGFRKNRPQSLGRPGTTSNTCSRAGGSGRPLRDLRPRSW